jgi:outer membrane protein assembly factor BamD (BamD/ComL family)
MNRWLLRLALIVFCVLALPTRSPAPLVYRPGEGWVYEAVGGGKWLRTHAKEQYEVAQAAFDGKDYSTAFKAARRTLKIWPQSDYAPKAEYLIARCYEARHQDEKAFKEYQKLLQKYPKIDNYQEIVTREYEIANRFLHGQWFRLWGYIPFFPSMDKTVAMYEKLIKNGPYSAVAPQAQLNIGAAREKQVSFFNRVDPFREAVKAYETAADRYRDKPQVASEALFKAGYAYYKQAKKAEYDQGVAGQAISTFDDFVTLYPSDARAAEAQKLKSALKTEQARGSFEIARFYEKKGRWLGAQVYYNEAYTKDPYGPYAQRARERLDAIKHRAEVQTASK